MKFFLLSLLILITFADVSEGCSQTKSGEPPCASWTRADVVFSGKVLRVEDSPKGEDYPKGSKKLLFQVLQNFKGADNPTFAVVTNILIGTDGVNPIKKGETWIVYARNDIVGKSFTEFRRARVEPKTSNEELETLKCIIAGKTSAAISGQIVSQTQNAAYLFESVEITVEGNGQRYSAKTDADGFFDFPMPSDGKYRVELKFPYDASLVWDEGLLGTSLVQGNPTVFKYNVSLNDGDCVYSFFEVSRK